MLINDLLKRDDIFEWNEYLAQFQQWQKFLELQFGIEKYQQDVAPDKPTMDFVRATIDQMERQANIPEEEKRKDEAIEHDIETLAIISSLRKQHDGSLSSAPFLLSFDQMANSISNMGMNGEMWDDEIVLHPRKWLNYILAFTSSELNYDQRTDISRAILSTSIKFEDPLDVDDYIELLRTKLDINVDNQELLREYILESPLSEQFTKAVERGDPNSAMETAKEILSDEEWQNAFIQRGANEKQLESAQNRVEELEEEVTESKTKAQAYEKALETQNKIVLDIPQLVQNEGDYSAEKISELNENLITLINLIECQLTDDIKHDLPDAPNKTSNLEQVSDWTEKIIDSIESVSEKSEKLEVIYDIAVDINNNISGMIS